ncbi:hypothetical protein F0919_17700 [Taibaiella lutea]|uniref:Lipocalin-like domain-containing protein n=1 Tax=Taibaiella lutea TaxID=2608001 RepID=A0A5M6CBW3_9BACT|nr:hypothetical protein [Taibaiella lutea]KAA5532617.1 hypothetical protein F0919_17700 [Taibaiella lutea]
MKNYSKNLLITGTVILFASCSPRMAGTWNIEKYEVNEAGKSTVSVANIGSITFDKNNTGVKDIQYAIFQNEYTDKAPFKWHKINENTISIEGDTSDLTKSWLIIEDKRKEQVWKSTDGSTKVQTLTLTKQ